MGRQTLGLLSAINVPEALIQLVICFGSERKLTVHVIEAMERRETTAHEHWTVKADFAFVLTCFVGAEIALYSGLPLVPPNWP